MTIQYTVYDTATGAILRTGTAMTEASARLQGSSPGTNVIITGSDPVTQVVDVTAIPIGGDLPTKARPPITVSGTQIAANKTSIVANGADALTISPIPNGATYQIDVPTGVGIDPIANGTIGDGSLTLTTTVAGSYTATIKYGTNLDFVVNFNAA
jgi:hypothetical protein